MVRVTTEGGGAGGVGGNAGPGHRPNDDSARDYPADDYAEEVIGGVESEIPSSEFSQAPAPLDDEIRRRAYDLWVDAGRPEGGADGFWEQAEQELAEGGPANVEEEPK